MKKFLWLLLGLIVLPVLAVSAYWFSGWVALPATVPQQQQLHQPELTNAAAGAMQALLTARTEQSLPALTAAVVWKGELVWAGAAGFAGSGNVADVAP